MRGKKKGGTGEGSSGRKGRERKIPGQLQPELKVDGGFRIPSIFMVPVGLAVGWFVASWAGAIFGGIIGVFLWRSRA
jgi:hypothetical protein